MLIPRIITSIVLLCILAVALFIPPFHLGIVTLKPFELFVALLVGVAIWESLRLTLDSSKDDLFKLGMGIASLITLTFLFRDLWLPYLNINNTLSSERQTRDLFGIHTLFWIIFAFPCLFVRIPRNKTITKYMSVLIVFSLLVNWLALVDAFSYGWQFLLSLLATVWVADIGAYFFGRFFGRYKLAPSISPGKTIEGAIGGTVAVIVFSIFIAQYKGTFASVLFLLYGEYLTLFYLLLICLLAISGDLFESWLKRRTGRKDSSQVLPGHGGVYDRIDALIPVLPFAILLC